jgi:2-oxoacid dehydrogenases acyltransferase (catalytic domain)
MPLFRRKDGDLVDGVAPLRRMMPFVMPTRTESFVLYAQQIDASPTKAFLRELNAKRDNRRPVTRFHLLLRAITIVMHERPRLNRFFAGGRLYQRRGVWVSFAAKQSLNDDSALFTLKRQFHKEEALESMVEDLYHRIDSGRDGQESQSDKEIKLLLHLPPSLLHVSVSTARVLNNLNLLPYGMIEIDPLFSSVFVANLGSLGIDAAYHHNFEYGTCPLFMTIGRLRRKMVVSRRGSIEPAKTFELKWTYDERIEDGFYCAASMERLRHYLEKAPEELL